MAHGLILGKFLPYHEGHAHLIRTGRGRVDALTVLVCSIPREPIPGVLRHQWVRASHPDCRVVHVAEDVPQAPDDDPGFWPIWVDLIRRHAGAVDVVFTSEAYGDELARRIGARHVAVDGPRTAVPVSGTAIRSDPLAYWAYIPPIVRPYFVRRVAVLGAESTGKTTLAQALARHFATVWVAEYGRIYCEDRDALALQSADFDAIGRGQIAAEETAATRANRVLICDTDVHTTCTWSDLVIGTRSVRLTEAAASRRYDLTLLLGADVPWIADGTRVLQDRRDEHTARLRQALAQAGQPYTLVDGDYDRRFAVARAAVAALVEGGRGRAT